MCNTNPPVFHLTSASQGSVSQDNQLLIVREDRQVTLQVDSQICDLLWSQPLTAPHPPTCVEDAGGQGGRRGLIQDQLPHHHPDGVAGEPPLQEPHPEEVEVTMETEGDHGDVARVAPVHFVPPREPLVDKVPSGEQAAVQSHVGHPREATDVSEERLPHCLAERNTALANLKRAPVG